MPRLGLSAAVGYGLWSTMMSGTVQCARCGQVVSTSEAGFVSWYVSAGGGQMICPHCLTPSEKVADDTALLTDGPDDRLLRDLDPDNDTDGPR